MSKEGESALQHDLFTAELVDNRTTAQKKRAKEAERPQQGLMFSQREMAQFGVEAHPKLPLSLKTKLELLVEDNRTEEEIAADIQREALKNNLKMLEEDDAEEGSS